MHAGVHKGRPRDGHGSCTFPGKYFHYSGEWRRGKMHGSGAFTMGDGTTYEGEFHDGEIEGVGLKRWPDGSSYSGHFHQGEMHEEGVYLSAKGERYEGHWENNQRCGYGVLQLSNGDLYSGEFAAHLPHGRGKMVQAATGHVYDGEWVAGTRCGIGQLQDPNGKRLYEGHWSGDHRHGDGAGVLSIVNTGAEADKALWYDGRWKVDEPEARTSKIVVMTMSKREDSRPATASEKQEYLSEVELHELPAPVIVENMRIPTLAVVCISQQASTSNDAVRAQGEYGRRFRLNIFEGSIPPQTSGGPEVEIVAGSPWQFVLSDQSSQYSGSGLPLSSCSNEAPASTNFSTDEVVDAVEGSNTPTETRLDVVIAEAVAGLAVFRDLLLPESTRIGDYYLVCESMASDSLPPAFISLSIR